MERFKNWRRPLIRHNVLTEWFWLVLFPEYLKLGEQTDIGAFTLIVASCGVKIGHHAQIGSHCAIYSESTIDGKKGQVTIGIGAKIGSHCTIMPGVKIGRDAIIGAHSFVNRDIPANAIAWGTPAKVR